LTSVFEKVYEIGLYFRAEESRTTRHLSEFISVDVEEAFADISDVMRLQEELTVRVIGQVMLQCEKELVTLAVELRNPTLPMRRYTYDQILNELNEVGQKITWGEDIPTVAYRELGNLHKGEFYFITDWPTKVRPFYIKPKPSRPELCDAFDFMYEWIEVTSGGTRSIAKMYTLLG
jgi:aspartyl-tRNA synthetase